MAETGQRVIVADGRGDPSKDTIPCLTLDNSLVNPYDSKYTEVYSTSLRISSYSNQSSGECLRILSKAISLLKSMKESTTHTNFSLSITSLSIPVYLNSVSAYVATATFLVRIIEHS